jgi:hypothetical protein
MPFPRRFQSLIETKPGDVVRPAYVWVTWLVCAVTTDSCGWAGWYLESAHTDTGAALPADDQRCPACGREAYRTIQYRYDFAVIQCPPHGEAGTDYGVVDIEYE